MHAIISNIFEEIVNYAILLAEFAGVAVLVFTLIKSFIGWKKG